VSEAPQAGGGLGVLWRLLRPRHWVKNVFVLAPLIFARRTTDASAWLAAAGALAGFCLLSSAVYIFNDIRDADDDRRHPVKRLRPLASGEVGAVEAAMLALVCLAVGLTACVLVCWAVLVAGLCYVGLNVLYTLRLRRVMIVDVICIALGFVLRAMAGALALSVPASGWLLVCTFTLCVFLGFVKRRYELAQLESAGLAGEGRAGPPYGLPLLDQFIAVSAGAAIVCYVLYTIDSRTVLNLRTDSLVLSIPPVVYCILRMIHLVRAGRFTDPTEVVTSDAPFVAALLLWAAIVAATATWGAQIEERLAGLIAA